MLLKPLFLWCFLLPTCLSAVANPVPSEVKAPPGNIIDFLSSDVQYSYFLRHLQKHSLVPTINAMQNVTVFAPINSAFTDSNLALNDTAENLLRYFSDQRFRVSYLQNDTVLLNSLYETKKSGEKKHWYPLKVSLNRGNFQRKSDAPSYTLNDFAEIIDADDYVKHQRSFIQTIDRLIPASFSICDFLLDMRPETCDINGHSIALIKSIFRSAFALNKKAFEHPTCHQFLANVSTVLIPSDSYLQQSLSELERKFYTAIDYGLNNTNFYPTKSAVREMQSDILSLISNILIPDTVGGINGTNSTHGILGGGNSYLFQFDSSSDTLTINKELHSRPGSTSLTLNDGVVHLFDNTMLSTNETFHESQPGNFFVALNVTKTPIFTRKALYAMHYSHLVEELHFRRLGNLIGNEATNQTILVDFSDRDDFKDDEFVAHHSEISSELMIPEDDSIGTESFSSRQNMHYRFLSGAIDFENELSQETPIIRKMANSKLCSKKRIGSCYRVKVSGVLDSDGIKVYFNTKFETGPPVKADFLNMIYVTESEFNSPNSFKTVMGELISDEFDKHRLNHIIINKDSCLATLEYLHSFKLFHLDDNHKGYTIFLPCGKTVWYGGRQPSNPRYTSWKSLGLILKYMEKNEAVFENIVRGIFLEDLIYSNFGLENEEESSITVKTLRGDYYNVSETYQSGDSNHIISVNNTALSVPLNSDILFDQGVIHITEKVLLPEDLSVPLADLVDAAQDFVEGPFSFLNFIKELRKVHPFEYLDLSPSSNTSFFVPSIESLQNLNISADYGRLTEFMQSHTLANEEAHKLVECLLHPDDASSSSYIIQTNKARARFRCTTSKSTGKAYLTLESPLNSFEAFSRKRQVKVLNYGCSHVKGNKTSCIFALDRPIEVNWFDPVSNFLHVHIGWISVGIGVVIGIILFGFCATTVVLCLSRPPKKKPIEENNFKPVEGSFMRVTSSEDFAPSTYDFGYETDDDMLREQSDQLLPLRGERMHSNYGSMSPMAPPSAPRKIKGSGLIKTINRDRHLP